MLRHLLTLGFPIVIMILTHFELQAQKLCAFDDRHQFQLVNNPEYKKHIDDLEKQWQEYLADPNHPRRTVIEGVDTIFEIPVVVHVIHTGGAIGTNYNRSNADIEAWVEYTNQIFAGTAPGYVGVGAGGSKIPVRLVLAKRTIDCEPTNGIVRINASSNASYVSNGVRASTSSGITEASLYAMSRWNTDYYYNIYVVNKIDGEDGYTSSSYIAGFAYFPGTSSSVDGSVMLSYIAEEGESTFAHEMGHAFGLYHTFEGASSYTTCPPAETSSNCSTLGDKVCDTERGRALLGVACPSMSATNPCTGSPYAGVQYNVMNYSNCPNRFTPGQAERAMFQLLSYRGMLVNSLGGVDIEESSEVTLIPSCPVPANTSTASYGTGPTRVQLETLDVSSTGKVSSASPHYIDYSTNVCINERASATLMKGGMYSMYVTTVNYAQFLKVYMDYNNDGIFNETDEVIFDEEVAPGVTNITFTVPPTAAGETYVRLRVRSDDEYASSPSSACIALAYGQTEDYAIYLMNAPLNHQEKNFMTYVENCTVYIQWNLSDARFQIDNIELQKSIDGQKFHTIEYISVEQYTDARSLTDSDILSNILYYRLKMRNVLGQESYTQIEKVEIACDDKLLVYPNPSTGIFTIQYMSPDKNIANIEVINLLGSVVHRSPLESTPGLNQQEINLSSLSKGLYLLRLTQDQNQQIIKVYITN